MASSTAHSGSVPVGQLARWNKVRFDACIAYMSKRLGRPLSSYDAAKLHVLADYFHVVDTGRPVIGGKLQRYEHGPVVRDTLIHVGQWPEASKRPKLYHAPEKMDLSLISPSEIEAMDRAVDTMRALNTAEKQWSYFHSDESPLGYAWKKANHVGGAVMDWNDVIDRHQDLTKENLSHIKALIQL